MTKKTNDSDFEMLIEQLNEEYGPGAIMRMDNTTNFSYDTISSGSTIIDWDLLGVGGYVKGRMYELMGWEATGKSTLCAHAISECQKKGGIGVYIDGENAMDKPYFREIGVDLNKLLISQPTYGEEGFDIAIRMAKTKEVDLIIIDSDSSLLPKKVVDGKPGDSAIGLKAKLNSDSYPKLKKAIVTNNTCVIVISQYREKIGVMYGDPTTTQGGNALKYYADCRMEIRRSTLSKENEETGEVTGGIAKLKTIKNKTFSPYRKCSIEIEFGKGINKISEILNLGVSMDIINKSGSWYSYGDTKLGQGTSSVISILRDNEELSREIKEKIIENIQNTYKQHGNL
jgi:recombination protein RecA